MQKRSFACIHFGGQGDAPKVIEIALEYRGILQKAIETAEFFLNSGGLSHPIHPASTDTMIKHKTHRPCN